MTKKIDIGRYVVPIVEKVLETKKDIRLVDKQRYKLAMEIWFDIDKGVVKAMSVDDIKFKPLNKLIVPTAK